MIRLPPQLKNQYEQLVQTEQRLMTITSQKTNWERQKLSIENAISELEAALEKDPNAEVYKSAGAVLIKVLDVKKVLEELKEKEELISMRLKTVNKQIERIKQQYDSMKEKFQQSLQQFSQSQDFQSPM
ncbi:MAG: prefoldin subunit [Candidatus Helarchaeota archaeon]